MRVTHLKSRDWLNVSGVLYCLLTCLLISLFIIAGSSQAARIPRSDTVSPSDPLLKQQGGASPTSSGDYISTSGGLGGPYRYYIEVPAGAGRLVVDIFDADVGMGGTVEAAPGRDRQRGGSWDTTTQYRLFNPGGTQVTTNFTSGDSTGPAGSDNAWLTLYDSSSTIQYIGVQTATTNSNTSLTVSIPPGIVGDFLIFAVSKDGSSEIITPLVGWTPVGLVSGTCASSACYLGVFYRWAQAGDASVQATWSGSEAAVGGVIRYRGVETTNPINVSYAATGTSAFPTAPDVTTTVANTRVVRIMGADDNDLPADPYPTGHTGRFALETTASSGNISGAAADRTQASAGSTGTAAFDLDPGESEQWRAVTVALAPSPASSPQAGHWLLEVDSSAGGDDIQAYGVRAHDGDSGPNGTEILIYADPFIPYGVNLETGGTDVYTVHPFTTGGCTVDINEFDMDAGSTGDQGQIVVNTRGGRQVLNIDDAALSGNNVWLGHETLNIDANPFQNIDHGVWTTNYEIGVYPSNANYTVYYSYNHPNPLPPTSLTEPSYRTYFPTDAGVAPVKPYLEQQLTYVSGPQAPTEGQDTIIQITVRVVNPTPHSITFAVSSNNLVFVTIPNQSPNAIVVLDGGLDATAGTTIVENPGVGNPGLISWSPGSVGSNTTKILTYRVRVRPNNGSVDSQIIFVTGQPVNNNGTQMVYLDETGNSSQGRAIYTFGQLCGLSVTEGVSITYASLSSFRAYTGRGQTRVQWETSGEAGTVGFILSRLNERSGRFEQVHEGQIRALMTAPQGGTYSVIDSLAQKGRKYTYQLIEIQSNGGRRIYGPFEITVDGDPVDLGGILETDTRDKLSIVSEPFNNILKEPNGVIREARKISEQAQWRAQQAGKTNQSYLGQKQNWKGGSFAKLAVTETGLYKVTSQQIANALGKPEELIRAGIRNGRLLITNRGSPVRYLSQDDGVALNFFAEAIQSIYTRENIYWVSLGMGVTDSNAMDVLEGEGPIAQLGQVFTETLHIEEDLFAAPVVPVNPGKSFWYWKILCGGNSETFEASSPDVVLTGKASLRVYVQGAISGPTLNEHQATVRVNGVFIGNGSWDNLSAHTLVFEFDASHLAESNTIEVLSSISSCYYLDAFDLSYPRKAIARNDSLLVNGGTEQIMTVDGFTSDQISVFDVTNPHAPTQILANKVEASGGGYQVSYSPTTPGGRYLALSTSAVRTPVRVVADVASSLSDSKNEADYLIIVPGALNSSAEALANYRSSNTGLQTKIALLEDIYDEFNYGIADPHAIRTFLKRAYLTWKQAPRYVVLLGKGTYDYKDVTQQGTNFLPALMTSTPDGMFASDNRFADVIGDDGIPEYALGRIPVLSNEEFNAYLTKLSASEGNPGEWGNNVLVTAEVKGTADFKADAQVIADIAALSGKAVYEIYLDDYPVAQAQAALQNSLNVNGMAVMVHLGHGGMDRLATGGLLMTPDVQTKLVNANKLPFLSALSCLINRFEIPGIDPMLGETLVLAPNGGASAVWAPTGTSLHTQAAILGEKMFEAIYEKGIGRVGDVVVEATRSFRSEATFKPVMLDVYTLLGDPAALIAGQPSGTRKGPSNPVVLSVWPSRGE